MKAFLPLLLLVPLSIPAQSTPAAAQQNATIHLYRNGSRGNAIQILIDGNKAFKLSYHESTSFELSPGYREIGASYSHQAAITIDARPGEERFLQLEMNARTMGALLGTTSPANAIALTFTKQTGIIDQEHMHEHALPPDTIAAILQSRAPSPPAQSSAVAALLPPLTDEQVRDAILQGARNEEPASIGLYLNDVQTNLASHALADGDYANSGFSISVYTPERWITYQAAVARRLMEPFDFASVTPEMRAMILRVVALPKVPDRLNATGMAAASSVARIVLCSRSRQDIVQPLNEQPTVVTVDSALRSKDYVEVASTFNMNEVKRLRAMDPKGEFTIVVIAQDGSRKFFDVKSKFAGWL
jgi:hypothetical protein